MNALFSARSLSVARCYRLLDWLDKVRIGLWLGYHTLHKEIFEPKFRIDARLGKKDRVAIISVDPDDGFKGISIGGCDNNVFRTSQSGIYLRFNNVRILSVSFDYLIAPFNAFPSAAERRTAGDAQRYRLAGPRRNPRCRAPLRCSRVRLLDCWLHRRQTSVADVHCTQAKHRVRSLQSRGADHGNAGTRRSACLCRPFEL